MEQLETHLDPSTDDFKANSERIAGLVDELIVYVAPKLLGNDAQALLQLPDIRTLAEGIALEFVDVAMVGKDCRMRLRVLPARSLPAH